MVKIIVDCFGGDHSPEANIDGAIAALRNFDDLHIILTGDEEVLKAKLAERSYPAGRIEIVHAPQVIDCNDRPTDAIRMKRDSYTNGGMASGRQETTARLAVEFCHPNCNHEPQFRRMLDIDGARLLP